MDFVEAKYNGRLYGLKGDYDIPLPPEQNPSGKKEDFSLQNQQMDETELLELDYEHGKYGNGFGNGYANNNIVDTSNMNGSSPSEMSESQIMSKSFEM